jgi:hypothetical protein
VSPRKSAVIFAPTEAELHQAVAEYLDWALLPPAIYSTFPAGWGRLSKATAGRLKGSGLKPGMPDLFVFDRHELQLGNRVFPKIVGIELKARGELPSAAQQLMFPMLRQIGIPIHICRCVEDVALALVQEHITMRTLRWHEGQRERSKRPLDETSERPAATGGGNG